MPILDPTILKSPFMSPDEFLEKMKKCFDNESPEWGHINADNLMCDLLRKLGYGDGIDFFEKQERWYS